MPRTLGIVTIVGALLCTVACSASPEQTPSTSQTRTVIVETSVTVPRGGSSTTAPAETSASQTVASDTCDKGWSTLADTTAPHLVRGDNALYDVRSAAHDVDCFDRVVFDIATDEPVGFHVEYVDVVQQDGSGQTVPVAGGAALRVVIDAWAMEAKWPNYRFTPSGWHALQDVAFAGSFEGQTTFALGVARRLPFAVYRLPASQGTTRVVVDIAHQ